MAGDWIKMRLDLHEDPAVIGIAEAVGIEEDLVVGKLHRLWSWANRQTIDGNAPSVSISWVDRYLGVSGFAAAMVAAGWLETANPGIRFPKYDSHNSESAKKRAVTAKRVAKFAAKPANATTNAGSVSPALGGALPREEKRREEESNTPLTPKGGEVGLPFVESDLPKTPKKSALPVIPPTLASQAFSAAWSRWLAYRVEIRKPLKAASITATLSRLAGWGEAAALASIDASIANGWQGLFEPKTSGAAGGPMHASRLGRVEAPPGKYDCFEKTE